MGTLQQIPQKVKLWTAERLERSTTRLYAWIVMQKLSNGSGYIDRDDDPIVLSVPDPAKMAVARRIVEQELAEILKTAERYVGNYLEEKQIVHERLARRYDPGLAMNEAFTRAAKKVEEEKPPHPVSGMSQELSPNQQKALAFQERFLRENARRS